jgi:hypothetical protein
MFMIGRTKGRDEMKLIGTPGQNDENNQIEMNDNNNNNKSEI